ncbi:unnamed protein product [Meganyctiphanes norvegica]|uniref:EGF-like domain-containing protein n=1 Tax=Meganyctiphanes norvegica TaxID=48144 RepID=A0AAV2S3A8_MEGNR
MFFTVTLCYKGSLYAENHTATCTCHDSLNGNPYAYESDSGCHNCINDSHCRFDEACVGHTCNDVCSSLCVGMAICTSQNHAAACTCRSSLVGNPYAHKVDSGCHNCVNDSHCPNDKHCRDNHCLDPCVDYYCNTTNNATCNVINHEPYCLCPGGYKQMELTNCEKRAGRGLDIAGWPHWWPYAAGAAAGALLIVVVVVLVLVYLKRKNKRIIEYETELNNLPEQGGRRGSAHDSENSLYSTINGAMPTENAQRRGSAHDSENSLYGTIVNRNVQRRGSAHNSENSLYEAVLQH